MCVIIDDNLNWSEHIKTFRNKILKTIGVLYKTRYYLNEKSLFLILNSLFISHIKYGLLCWEEQMQVKLVRLVV